MSHAEPNKVVAKTELFMIAARRRRPQKWSGGIIGAMKQNRFEYTFDDESERNRIILEYSDSEDERLCVSLEGSEAVVYANRNGFLALAKLCLKLALGSYKPGFHLHLRENFGVDAAQPDQLRLVLVDEGVDDVR
jgi:hypothetical protein